MQGLVGTFEWGGKQFMIEAIDKTAEEKWHEYK